MNEEQQSGATPEVSGVTTFSREFGMTPAEALRTLRSVFAGQDCDFSGNRVIGGSCGRHLEIVVQTRPERGIAAMRLPCARIDFRFSGYTSNELERLMARFDLYFHRGGG